MTAQTLPDQPDDSDLLTIEAVDMATLAREIAMDILEVPQVLALHRLTDEEWEKIQAHPRFISMLGDMTREWNGAENTKERVRIKAATGLEMQLEQLVRDVADPLIPLAQRTEAAKFLARLGELDGSTKDGLVGEKFHITLNIGSPQPVHAEVTSSAASLGKLIEGTVNKP